MSVGVKICGLTEEQGLEACLQAGADWIGFVFFRKSPRHVTPQRASALSRRFEGLPDRPLSVGLFVEPTDDDIAAVLDDVALDALQLYTTPERALHIRSRYGKEVWLSCPVLTADDLPRTCGVERLVIESRAPAGASRPGGNGLVLPWHLTHGWNAPAPWILAGGLTPENVALAIKKSGASAVDVSSGVEKAPGIKDPDAVRRFIQEAKRQEIDFPS